LGGKLQAFALYNMINRISYIFSILLLLLVSIPATAQDWVTLTNDEEERVEAHSAVIDKKIFLFGGFQTDEALGENQSQETDQTAIYDPAADTWTKFAPLPIPVTHVGSAVVDREVWLAGGFAVLGFNQAIDHVYIYDVDANSWSQGPSLPAARSAGTLVRNGRKLHYISGLENRNDGVVDHWVLDLDEPGGPQTWNTLASIPETSNHLSGIAVGGKIYAIGGQVNHDIDPFDVDFAYEYDPVTDSWSEKASMPIPRSHMEPGTFVVDGKIILVGGKDGSFTCSDRVSSYDPQTDTWAELFTVPDCLLAPSGKVIDDQIYVSHGGLVNVFDPQTTMRKRNFPRNPSDVMDFYPQTVDVDLFQGETAKEESVLFTFTDVADYTIDTSNLPAWITDVTATSGEADHAGAEIDVTLDATVVGAGVYSHTFVATASGYQTASYTINLTVMGDGAAEIQVDPATADLGTIPLGYTASQEFIISNSGEVAGEVDALGSFVTTGGVDYRYGGDVEGGSINPDEMFVRSLSITPISEAGSVTHNGDVNYSVSASTAGSLIARINAGGGLIDEATLPDWSADVHFEGGQGFQNEMVGSVEVSGGTEPSMYLTERSAGANLGSFAYRVPVPQNGAYITRLHFAETFFGAPGGSEDFVGRRVFDVNIEGGRVELDEYDIAAEVGPVVGVVKTFVNEVYDGVLDIEFSATVDQPKVTGIEVFQVDPVVHQYLAENWNMISLPATPDINDYESIFTDVTLLQQPYGYGENGYTQTSQLFTGQAYWVATSAEGFQVYDGGEVTTSTVTTIAGWNMIGGPSCVYSLDQVVADAGVVAGDAFGYDPTNGYVVVDAFIPGKGYWVRSEVGGTIAMDCGTVSGAPSKAGHASVLSNEADFDRLTIIDGQGRTYELLLSEDASLDVTTYQMPPVPFKSQPDVRFRTDSRLSIDVESIIQMQGLVSPLTVQLQGASRELEVFEGSDWSSAGTLYDGVDLALYQQDIRLLRIRSGSDEIPSTPASFALHGVYPNPFNSAATLLFDAPDNGSVKVEVYSMLGQRVSSYESVVEAGAQRTVELRGFNLPAGAYVYKLTLESAGDVEIATGQFVVTR